MGAELSPSPTGIVLSDAFVDGVPHDKAELCFKTTGDKRVFGFVWALIRLRKNKEIEGQYVFSAFGTDGTTPVNYNIALTGTADAPFAPDPDETTNVTWEDALLGAQDESEESACAPDGSHRIIVDITGLQLKVEIKGDPVT